MITYLNLGEWRYQLGQNSHTGELIVFSREKVKGAPVLPPVDPPPPQQGLLEKAAGYLKAEASALMGSVPLPVLEARKAACDGCDSARKAGPEEWYCKSCGCPEWKRSQLQAKWTMPAATCPLKKWPEIK
jgi:hypothetical protein